MIGQTLLLRGHLCTNDAYMLWFINNILVELLFRVFEYVCGIIFFWLDLLLGMIWKQADKHFGD